MKRVFSVLVMLLAVSCLFGCKGGKNDTIKIGSAGPLSGSASIYGQAVKKGVELAIEEINAAGGVNVDGKMMKFELVDFVNDEADAGKAAAGLTKLISSKSDIIVGAVTSGATEGLINEAVKYGIPVITPTGTADKLTVGEDGTKRDERSNVFRACFYDSYQGTYMGQYAANQGIKKLWELILSSVYVNGDNTAIDSWKQKNETLSKLSKKMNLREYLSSQTSNNSSKFDADLFEAFIGAYYLDDKNSGLDDVYEFLYDNFSNIICPVEYDD